MKILQVIPYFYPAWSFGGPVRCVFHLSRELAKRGHEITVYTTNAFDTKRNFKIRTPRTFINGILVHYFRNVGNLRGLYISPSILRSARNELKKFNVIHMHEFRSFQNIVFHYYCNKLEKPYVLTAHGTVPRTIEKFVLKKLYDYTFGFDILKDARKLIALSTEEAQQFMSVGIKEDNIIVIPNGIDLDSFFHPPALLSFKKKFGIPDANRIILYMGRIHKQKGLNFLLNAFSKVQDLDVVLVIAGPDQGYLHSLKKRAHELGISDKIIFPGLLTGSDRVSAYRDSYLIVYPSIQECFPLVPLEAAALSKPSIVTEGGVIAELVKNNDFGLSVPYGEAFLLKDAILTLLNNEKLAKQMGTRGKDFVTKNFSWEKIVTQIENIYLNVI